LRKTDAAILVTGASGFVGRHLVAALRAGGQQVLAVGKAGPRLDADTDWRAQLAGVRTVVHLAGRHAGDAAAFARYVAMTLNLGRQAESADIEHFVYLSSVKVNGDRTGPGEAFSERDVPDPRDDYGAAKLRMERGLAELRLPLTVIRPPLVYGPDARGNVRALARAVEQGWPLPLAAVANRRSLIGIGNLCHFIQHVLDTPEARGETYLVADGRDVSTAELLRAVARALDRPSRLFAVPPPLLEYGLRLVGHGATADRLLGDLRIDSGKARRLGWEPPLSLDEGLTTALPPLHH